MPRAKERNLREAADGQPCAELKRGFHSLRSTPVGIIDVRDGKDETAHRGGEGAELENELSRDVLKEESRSRGGEEGEQGLRHVAEHDLYGLLVLDLLVV